MTFNNQLLRNETIDIVKTIAIWNVVLCHVAAAPFSGGIVGTTNWYAALFWTSLWCCIFWKKAVLFIRGANNHP